MSKTIKQRLCEILEKDLGGTWFPEKLKVNKGPRWANDVWAWEGVSEEKMQVGSYDTMTDIVKSGAVCFISDERQIGPKEISAYFQPLKNKTFLLNK